MSLSLDIPIPEHMDTAKLDDIKSPYFPSPGQSKKETNKASPRLSDSSHKEATDKSDKNDDDAKSAIIKPSDQCTHCPQLRQKVERLRQERILFKCDKLNMTIRIKELEAEVQEQATNYDNLSAQNQFLTTAGKELLATAKKHREENESLSAKYSKQLALAENKIKKLQKSNENTQTVLLDAMKIGNRSEKMERDASKGFAVKQIFKGNGDQLDQIDASQEGTSHLSPQNLLDLIAFAQISLKKSKSVQQKRK